MIPVNVPAVAEYLKELGKPLPDSLDGWIAAAIAKRVDDDILRELMK